MEKCKRCNEEFESYDSLRRHVGRAHKIDSPSFYVEYHLNDIWPVCKCGCNQKVLWKANKPAGFRNYCAGHQSRISNNWGHNATAVLKSAETRRKQFASGERKVWNDGLTKETDERVKNNGLNTSISILSDEGERGRRAKRMSENRKSGIIPTLYGKDHSQWNGGTSRLRDMIYADVRLYKQWKYPILVRDGFKCSVCPNTKNLHVHHNQEEMCEIVKSHLTGITEEMLNDFEMKRGVVNKIVNYHIMNKVSGITLCEDCHNKLHPNLNFKH